MGGGIDSMAYQLLWEGIHRYEREHYGSHVVAWYAQHSEMVEKDWRRRSARD